MISSLRKLDEYRYEIPKTGKMLVPGRIYASEKMIGKIERERVAEQVANVAQLPGIVGASLAMPDCHWGYGAPVGGVAATDPEEGVISPGLVGFDIGCGMRLLRSDLKAGAIKPAVEPLMDALYGSVASGVGKGGALRVDKSEMTRLLERGARWAVEKGLGEADDLEILEGRGTLAGADAERVGERAMARGRDQVGTLGSGNHFLELQEVDAVFDERIAEAFGLFRGQFVIMIHTGSRGLGYQICSDALKSMQQAMRRYRISLPDRQLACAPYRSPEGQEYEAAMRAGANFARANRQVIAHSAREACMRVLGMSPRELGLRSVYDVSHNLAMLEEHELEGRRRKLLVHRKGATRAFPAGHPELPARYRESGQPVLVPGTMGTNSFVLVGTETAMRETFGTVCHGAGRVMSRTEASRRVKGHDLLRELAERGIAVRTDALRGLAEEAPFAYKDVSAVVDICHEAGLARRVARLRPLGVLKG